MGAAINLLARRFKPTSPRPLSMVSPRALAVFLTRLIYLAYALVDSLRTIVLPNELKSWSLQLKL
jgi:hypothetical protein